VEYILAPINGDINNLIKDLVQQMCKYHKINYEKQEYRALFSNEDLLVKNNGVKFTSGSKKYLCFYGKVYLNKKNKIIESVYLQDGVVELEPKSTEMLLIFGGVDNSTVLENDEALLHFYIAPKYFLDLQDPLLWKPL
jgi:hypothetical protein